MSDAPQVREQDPSLGGAPVDQGARTAGTETEERVLTTEEVVEDLRRQLAEKDQAAATATAQAERERQQAETNRRARLAAEARARDAEAGRAQAEQTGQRSADEARLDAVKNALDSHKGQLASLEAQKATLLAEGDFVQASKLDGQMAIVGARIVQLEDGQVALQERIKMPPQDQGRTAGSDAGSAEARREAFIAAQPPKVQDWLRSQNGERFFTDSGFRDRVAKAADFATSVKSLDIASQEYIDFIEEAVGLRTPAAQTPSPAQNQGQQPSQQQGRDADDRRMITAPAGGSNAGSVRSNPDGSSSQVYLTSEEREMARRMDVSEAEWARNKAAALREGLIGPNARNR